MTMRKSAEGLTRQLIPAILIWIWLFSAVPVLGGEDPLLAEMTAKFNALTNYTTLLDSEEEGARRKILYTYKKPGFIRMDFIHPHKGAMLIYNPITHKVTLRPFSKWFFKFALNPGNPLITDSKGHTIDQSDIGALIRSIILSSREGSVTQLPPETLENLFCPRLRVEGTKATYLLWIHPEFRMPIKIVKLFAEGEKEVVYLRNLTIDAPLDDTLFIP